MSDFCRCGHHRDEHKQERYYDGSCYGDRCHCPCERFWDKDVRPFAGQRGSEAGCYS